MTVRHAILGSRRYPDLDAVAFRVRQLAQRHGTGWILVSGGSQGACFQAEQAYKRLGGRILSLRPGRLPAHNGEPRYGVRDHRHSPGLDPVVVLHELTFDDFRSAAMYRSMVIAERSTHGDIFWDGASHGSAMEVDFFAAANTPLKVWRPGEAPV